MSSGQWTAIALDPAASEFYRDGSYHVAGEALSTVDTHTDLAYGLP